MQNVDFAGGLTNVTTASSAYMVGVDCGVGSCTGKSCSPSFQMGILIFAISIRYLGLVFAQDIWWKSQKDREQQSYHWVYAVISIGNKCRFVGYFVSVAR